MINTESVTDIFFDLDHTLWDFEKNSELTFRKIFKESNLPFSIDDFLKSYNPINHAQWKLYRINQITQEELRFNRLYKTFEKLYYKAPEGLVNRISEQYITYLSTFQHLIDGTIELLDALNNRFRLHIITNGFDMVQHYKIENSGIASYFEHVFTAEKIGFKKPHPQIFIESLKTVNTTAEASIMIGDSFEADILGALDQGMQAIHFNSHNEETHDKCPIVYSLHEIKTFF
ncbi:MAG: putative hydrolase of the HAD superfamily [Flavobacteriaceae bacterium]|jgi:putative hydrolase of the HAD superfamily|tara:strand:- start:8258 stop:8950 length:693 start_codon:yes stop_codon:yes gene_type:complete